MDFVKEYESKLCPNSGKGCDIHYKKFRRHSKNYCNREYISNTDAINGRKHKYFSSNYNGKEGVWMCANCKHFCFGNKYCKPSPYDN